MMEALYILAVMSFLFIFCCLFTYSVLVWFKACEFRGRGYCWGEAIVTSVQYYQ